MDINEAIKIIEKDTVYRNTVLTDKTGFFIAINAPDELPFELTHKKILALAEVVKTKPKRLR